MRKLIYTIILIAILVLSTIGCTNVHTDILKGGDFEYPGLDELQEDWNLNSGNSSSSTNVFTLSNGSLGINTSSAGWAYASQELKLKSNSYYKISYTFDIASIAHYGEATSYDGLYIGFLEDKNFNIGESPEGVIHPIVHRSSTNGDVNAEIYLKTSFITSASLAIFVGTEESPIDAVVRIRDISIQRVSKKSVIKVEDPETGKKVLSVFRLDTKTYGANNERNIVYIVLGALFTFIVAYIVYIMYRRNMLLEPNYKNNFLVKLRESKYLGLLLVLAFTAFVRLFISVVASVLASKAQTAFLGYNIEAQAAQGMFIANYGTVYLKQSLLTYTTNFGYAFKAIESEPLMLYIVGLAGLISKLFGGGIVLTTFVLKCLAIASDIGVIVIMYSILAPRIGRISTIIMTSLYSALPIVFSLSTGWGVGESIFVFLIVLTFYFILKNNYWGVSASFFAAFCVSINAIFVLPIIIFYVINQFILNKKLRLPIILSLVVAFGLFYALTVPFNYLEIKEGKIFASVSDYYNAVLVSNDVYTANAFNFQALLKNNFEPVTLESLFITVLFDAFVIALVAVGYFKNKNRMELLLLSGLFMCMLFTFTNRMTPITMYLALPLMFIYAIMNQEKRVFAVTIAYAVLMFINASYVYMVVGYSASGIEIMTYDSAVMYVFGAINIIVTAYLIYVVYDIVASRKASRIKPMNITYVQSIKLTQKRLKKSFYNLKKKFSR